MEAQIVRRVVAGTAAHFIDPEALCRVEGHARSYGIAVGRCAHEMQTKPVVLILCEVDQKHGPIAEVVDHGFEPAVVEEICDGEATAGTWVGKSRTGRLADVAELAVAEVVVEETGFAVEGA